MLSYKEYIDKYAKVAYDEYVNGVKQQEQRGGLYG